MDLLKAFSIRQDPQTGAITVYLDARVRVVPEAETPGEPAAAPDPVTPDPAPAETPWYKGPPLRHTSEELRQMRETIRTRNK